MYWVMQTSHLAGSHLDSRRVLRLAIIYDIASAGQRAMQLFAGLEGEIKFLPYLWRFDFIADASWEPLATSDALKADLLVISTAPDLDMPPRIQHWLASLLESRRGDHVALVALPGMRKRLKDCDSAGLRFLKNAAKAAGLEFFAAEPKCGWSRAHAAPAQAQFEEVSAGPLETDSSSAVEGGRSAFPAPTALSNDSGFYDHWGINE